MIAAGQGLGDGQPQAAALFAAAEHAVEGVEHAIALGGRNAGAAVFNGNQDFVRFFAGGKVDAPAFGGVAHGVVGQGFDQ